MDYDFELRPGSDIFDIIAASDGIAFHDLTRLHDVFVGDVDKLIEESREEFDSRPLLIKFELPKRLLN